MCVPQHRVAQLSSVLCSVATLSCVPVCVCLQLSRCLAFRQLLAEALAQALASTFPAAAATVDAVASNMQLYPAEGSGRAAQAAAGDWGGLVAGRHVCDLFHLPRPGLQSVGSPAVADPVVVNTLVGGCGADGQWWKP